jgi:hypothetical protein
MTGVYTYTGVAFFLCKMEVSIQSSQLFKSTLNIVGLGFDFLHTNTITVGQILTDPCLEAFAAG